MSDLPYRPRVKLGSLRQTVKKMAVTKAAGSKMSDEGMKKFLKSEKGLRRMTYGDQQSTVESWKGRHFIKDVKEKVKGSEEYRETLYSKKSTAAQEFRDTVKEEIRQETPAGPSQKELDRQKRIETARQNLHRYEQQKQVEEAGGSPLSSNSGNQASASSGPSRNVPLAGGRSSVPSNDRQQAKVAVVSQAGGTTSARDTGSLKFPDRFGMRARVLRLDDLTSSLMLHVLNAPPELAIFIGRDVKVSVPSDVRCWKNHAAVQSTEIQIAELVDIRGKVLSEKFVADEIYLSNDSLPDFVVHLENPGQEPELPSKAPDELVIG